MPIRAVVDANIIIALLIKPGKPRELFFDNVLRLYAPELLFTELEKHEDMVTAKAGLSHGEFNRFLKIVKERVTEIPESDFLKHLDDAIRISPDPEDAHYFAAALLLESAIWSNDKKLKNQQKVRVYATHELLESLKRHKRTFFGP